MSRSLPSQSAQSGGGWHGSAGASQDDGDRYRPTEQRGGPEAKVWEAAGGYAPTIGIIGAVMGLIQVMKHLEDIEEVGHGIAVAFVATVYGVAVVQRSVPSGGQ